MSGSDGSVVEGAVLLIVVVLLTCGVFGLLSSPPPRNATSTATKSSANPDPATVRISAVRLPALLGSALNDPSVFAAVGGV